jgi:hypothetical protein
VIRIDSFIRGALLGCLLAAIPAYCFGANAARQHICGAQGVELRDGVYRCVRSKGER